ncbi:hypothetical protein BN000_04333 [Neobacillus massiliamazoniensis]|uniref:Uncharacterized protein n=1 Tax=Neobacillus massiliamazoniensis TaxID=1499688 RepID=A0A0U1P238_9BACI|nr:hypothetical protein BN000_04333 [Neobacillus massiliamazoniensis]
MEPDIGETRNVTKYSFIKCDCIVFFFKINSESLWIRGKFITIDNLRTVRKDVEYGI